MGDEFGPGLPGQDPESHVEQLKAERLEHLHAASGDVAVALKIRLPNLARIELVVTFDDGMTLRGCLEVVGLMTKREALKQFPELAAEIVSAALRAGIEVPVSKRSGKRRRKNPAFKPVENPQEKAGPQ